MGHRTDGSPGRSRRWLRACVIALALGLATGASHRASAQDAASTCAPAIGRLVSLQGSVEIQRAGSKRWIPVQRLDTSLCPGNRLRTGALSRAALFLQPETLVRIDQNTTITLNQSDEEIEVEFFGAELAAESMNAKSFGAAYFITRFPKKFKVKTPHVNAAVEGTEFMVELNSDATKLTVIEGKVSSESVVSRDTQMVAAGQSLSSGAAGRGALTSVIRPQDAVQWVLRYPPISDGSNASRAEELLRAGSVDEALSEIDSVLRGDPGDSDALALRAIIQVAKNDKVGALESAARATTGSTATYRAWLALSYAQQANFNLEAALESAMKAESLQPASALGHARVAELHLSLGDSRLAEEAARAAIASSPAESNAHAMLGFVHLAQIKTRAAEADFEAAIERDSFSALPRLGLGLVMIRDGELAKGRQQIEIAVVLDPSNSLLRSYVGKAYYEENSRNRDALAAQQFELAKSTDPEDPTPWYYDAVLSQSLNRPIESLKSLQRSIELNDNRAVYRSRLLLDEDLAARGAQLARSFRVLGFEELARVSAYGSLENDPAEYSGHRLLADAFLDRPRHQVARVSEMLQSQIWQPLDVSPVDAQLVDDRSFILRHSGPTTAGLNEFNPLFVENGLRLEASALFGGNNTTGDQVLLTGIHDRVSATLGQFYYDSDGFEDGWGLRKSIQSLFVQGQITSESSVFAEYRNSEQTEGDLTQNFFGVTDSQRVTQDRELARVGFRFPISDWNVAGVITHQDASDLTEAPVGSLLFTSESDELSGELIATFRSTNGYLLAGAGRYDIDGVIEFFGSPFPTNGSGENLFAYGSHDLLDGDLQVQIGLSWDKIDRPDLFLSRKIDELSPKFGVVFRPWPSTTLRAAAFRAVRRSIIAEQTVEPTQVAGFNQFFDDDLGTRSERFGVGWDQKLSDLAFVGVELSQRKLVIPEAFSDPPNAYGWKERDYRGYWYFVLSDSLTLSVEYTYERITQNPDFAENFLDAETHKVPLSIGFFGRNTNLSLHATMMYVRQEGEFRADPALPDFVPGKSEFWTADLAAEFRLPGRRGLVTAEIRNVFDETFNFQETDIFSPTMARERLGLVKLSIEF